MDEYDIDAAIERIRAAEAEKSKPVEPVEVKREAKDSRKRGRHVQPLP